MKDVLNYLTVGMYEQHPPQHYAPAVYASALISKSIADIDRGLYGQKQPTEAFQKTDEPLRTLRRSYAFRSDDVLIADLLGQVPALYPLLKKKRLNLSVLYWVQASLLQLEGVGVGRRHCFAWIMR
jgi:hypothetical protein